MKRIALLLLALAMTVSFAACGMKSDYAASIQTGAVITELSANDAFEDVLISDEILGTLDGQTYTNPVFNIACSLDDNWTYATKDELLEMIGVASDAIQDESLTNMVEEGVIVYAMVATDRQNGDTITSGVQKLNAFQCLLSEAELVDANAQSTVDTFESAGIKVSDFDRITVPFAGQDRQCLHIEASINGMAFLEDCIFIKNGDYLSITAVSSSQADTLSETEARFTAIDVNENTGVNFDDIINDVADEEAIDAIIASLIVISFLASIWSIVNYILRSLSLYTIANRRGIPNSGLAWVPYIYVWTLGSLADQYDQSHGIKRRWRVALLVFVLIGIGATLAFWLYSISSVFIPLADDVTYLQDELFYSVLAKFFLSLNGFMLPVYMSSFALAVCSYICTYKLFESCKPAKALKLLLISLLVPFAAPFCLMSCRKWDALLVPPSIKQLSDLPASSYEDERLDL